jgi:hypothetical protein
VPALPLRPPPPQSDGTVCARGADGTWCTSSTAAAAASAAAPRCVHARIVREISVARIAASGTCTRAA